MPLLKCPIDSCDFDTVLYENVSSHLQGQHGFTYSEASYRVIEVYGTPVQELHNSQLGTDVDVLIAGAREVGEIAQFNNKARDAVIWLGPGNIVKVKYDQLRNAWGA